MNCHHTRIHIQLSPNAPFQTIKFDLKDRHDESKSVSCNPQNTLHLCTGEKLFNLQVILDEETFSFPIEKMERERNHLGCRFPLQITTRNGQEFNAFILVVQGAECAEKVIPKAPFQDHPQFWVIGHRGSGATESMPAVPENTIESFAKAAHLQRSANKRPAIEFDVHVTSDGIPIVFHDFTLPDHPNRPIWMYSYSDLIEELPYEPPTLSQVLKWAIEEDEVLCDIEIKYPLVEEQLDQNLYDAPEINNYADSIITVIDRITASPNFCISSFHPDICRMVRAKRPAWRVFFLTDAGCTVSPKRSPMDEDACKTIHDAVKFCLSESMDGLVSDSRAIHDSTTSDALHFHGQLLWTYGRDNNLPESVLLQRSLGVDAVIVDQLHLILPL